MLIKISEISENLVSAPGPCACFITIDVLVIAYTKVWLSVRHLFNYNSEERLFFRE
jgi:hypothetical protein